METKKPGRRNRSRAGLRPTGHAELPVPRTQAFLEEAHRQSLAIARSPDDAEDQRFVDAVADWTED